MVSTPSEELQVLLVEDNPGDARLVREALKDARGLVAELVGADSLREALRLVQNAPIQLILLDLGLPDASGLEALDAITLAAPDLPVIILTGLQDEDTALQALRLGAQDYLEKGEISSSTLVRAVRYAIERKRLQKVEAFISGAAQLLGSTLDLERILARLADLSVANLADYCAVDLVTVDGGLERLLVAHRDPEKGKLAEELRRIELDRDEPNLAQEAMRTREPVLVRSMTDEAIESLTQSPEHRRLVRSLRIRSYMALPLLAKDRLVAVLLLISSTREFTPWDLELSVRFAAIAAAAVDNSRVYGEAAEALRTRDRVLGIVAHDLRNPLGVIAMSAELLLDHDLGEIQENKQLQIIRRSADRMNRLIEDLLDIARIEQGQLRLSVSHRDPNEIVDEIVNSNASLASAGELSLESSPAATRPVLADYDRLIQVLTNLIGNAIKFTPAGGRISVAAENYRDCVRFSVSDTGPGIPENEIAQMFRPFWQGRARASGGAGLGLSVAKGIVEAHGGRIWVESTLGQGTTVSFTIPLASGRRADDIEL
ncbi:MAG: ATP-binding protein [Dehalococcoidia bacterium]